MGVGVTQTRHIVVTGSPIIKSFWSSSTIFGIMVVRTCITLTTQSRWSFTRFSLVISQDKAVICIVIVILNVLSCTQDTPQATGY